TSPDMGDIQMSDFHTFSRCLQLQNQALLAMSPLRGSGRSRVGSRDLRPWLNYAAAPRLPRQSRIQSCADLMHPVTVRRRSTGRPEAALAAWSSPATG